MMSSLHKYIHDARDIMRESDCNGNVDIDALLIKKFSCSGKKLDHMAQLIQNIHRCQNIPVAKRIINDLVKKYCTRLCGSKNNHYSYSTSEDKNVTLQIFKEPILKRVTECVSNVFGHGRLVTQKTMRKVLELCGSDPQ